jgi:hypothetical protein
MSEIFLTLVVEDILSEEVARRLLLATQKPFQVALALVGNGRGYLETKVLSFNDAAKASPFLMIADQDSAEPCAPELISQWMRGRPLHSNLMLRIAVREIEAWIMADRRSLSQFLNVPLAKIPGNLDQVPDPKQFLVNLARSSSNARVRSSIVPRQGSTANVGPNYNSSLTEFIREEWTVARALEHSDSLRRAFEHLKSFRPA